VLVLLRTAIGSPDTLLTAGGSFSPLLIDRLVLIGAAGLSLGLLALGRAARRNHYHGGGNDYRGGGCGLPLHEALSLLLGVAFSAIFNVTLLGTGAGFAAPDPSRLANLNFALFIAFSFLEMRGALLLALNLACVAVYGGFLAAAAQIDTDSDVGGQVAVALAGALLSAVAGFIREKSRRSKFLVAQHAHRQKLKCERLLINMLPSQAHVERLMAGEQVVEVLDDVTMLYSDIKVGGSGGDGVGGGDCEAGDDVVLLVV
jgi:hypothetical protein